MSGAVSRRRLGGQHHRYIHLSGEMSQPFSVPRVGKSGEMKCVLVGRSSDDGIHFAIECQPGGRLDSMACDSAGSDDPVPVAVALSASQSPAADPDATLRRYGSDLVLRADDGDLCVNHLGQGASRDLGSDATRITKSNR
jgi:hypothetical protein